jgi:hypothetical protein
VPQRLVLDALVVTATVSGSVLRGTGLLSGIAAVRVVRDARDRGGKTPPARPADGIRHTGAGRRRPA